MRGHVALPGIMIGDFIILRNDGSPVYNFCCAIDDVLMQITHVLRGEEHLPNTLRQIRLLKPWALTLLSTAIYHSSWIKMVKNSLNAAAPVVCRILCS